MTSRNYSTRYLVLFGASALLGLAACAYSLMALLNSTVSKSGVLTTVVDVLVALSFAMVVGLSAKALLKPLHEPEPSAVVGAGKALYCFQGALLCAAVLLGALALSPFVGYLTRVPLAVFGVVAAASLWLLVRRGVSDTAVLVSPSTLLASLLLLPGTGALALAALAVNPIKPMLLGAMMMAALFAMLVKNAFSSIGLALLMALIALAAGHVRTLVRDSALGMACVTALKALLITSGLIGLCVAELWTLATTTKNPLIGVRPLMRVAGEYLTPGLVWGMAGLLVVTVMTLSYRARTQQKKESV